MKEWNDDMKPDDALGLSVRELRSKLEEILARPKVTARDAEEAVEAARAIADLLRGEERALKLLRGGRPNAPSDAGRWTILAGLTLHEAARRVLERYGWPMHVKELALRVMGEGWTNPRAQDTTAPRLALQLAARLPRYPETFRRTAPNTFSLAEWGDAPPRRGRPKPHLGTFASDGSLPARDSEEELKRYFDDERNRWRSS